MAYVAIVLDEKSRNLLLEKFFDKIPIYWEVIAHHVTIHMGPLILSENINVGKQYNIVAKSFGFDTKVIAVGVELFDDIKSASKIPHVTIAVDRINGGKPVMSNYIKNWFDIENFIISGTLQQID